MAFSFGPGPRRIVYEKDPGQGEESPRLDAYWFSRLAGEGLTRGRIQEWIKAGRAAVDGEVCRKPSRRLAGGERLSLEPAAVEDGPKPEEGDLRVLYADDHLLVLDKPPGLTVHPAPSCPEGTLVNRLVRLYPHLADMDAHRPGIVHRIDKDTSGLLLAALSSVAKNRLVEDFAARRVRKTYLALCHGRPEPEEGEIDLPIGRDPGRKTRMAALPKGGRPALSRYRVVWAAPDHRACLLEVEIATGRTHQIRVHLAAVGHPLLGDGVYGSRQAAELGRADPLLGRLAARQALHAWKLAFRHPVTGREMAFSCPPPKDFWRLMPRLARRCQRAAVVGMPGGGKSAFCAAVARAGYPVFSADAAVADLYRPGKDGCALVAARFGQEFLDASGAVDKPALWRAIRASESFRRELMELIHPLVLHAMRAFFEEHAASRAAFAEIPLLHESGWRDADGAGAFDAVIGIQNDEAARQERLRARGLSEEDLAALAAWHWPQDKKLARCDLVVPNTAGLSELETQARRILNVLRERRIGAVRALAVWLRERGYADLSEETGR